MNNQLELSKQADVVIKLVKEVESLDIDYDDDDPANDELVQAMDGEVCMLKENEASNINNEGFEEQICYIVESLGAEMGEKRVRELLKLPVKQQEKSECQ